MPSCYVLSFSASCLCQEKEDAARSTTPFPKELAYTVLNTRPWHATPAWKGASQHGVILSLKGQVTHQLSWQRSLTRGSTAWHAAMVPRACWL